MNQPPTLTVVVVGRNVEGFSATLTASVTKSDSPTLAWIFVDDASNDATGELFERLGSTVHQSQVFHQPKQRGLAAGRNLGVQHASTLYVTFVDADDWLAPGHLGAVANDCLTFDVDLIRFGYVEVKNQRHHICRHETGRVNVPLNPREYIMPVDRDTLVEHPQAWAMVAKRSFLVAHGRFDESLRTCEDREWMWRLMLHADAVVVSDRIGYYWRRNVQGSLTQTGGSEQLDFFRAYDSLIDLLHQRDEWSIFLPKAYRAYCSILLNQLERADRLSTDDRHVLETRARKVIRNIPRLQLRLALLRFGNERLARIDDLSHSRARRFCSARNTIHRQHLTHMHT